jgi:hypothetical protein
MLYFVFLAKTHFFHGLIGNPSESDFRGMVRGNMIRNCPITSDDVTNVRAIFRPDLASIRGETVRRTPAPVVVDYSEVPQSLGSKQQSSDQWRQMYFFVDGTAFLITVSRRIKFVMAEHLQQVRMATSLCKHLGGVCESKVFSKNYTNGWRV